jgi:hypothetical protein
LYGVTFECDYPDEARRKPKVVRSLFEHLDPPPSSGEISQIIGQRLQQGLEIIAEILHPELFSGCIPANGAARLDGALARAI